MESQNIQAKVSELTAVSSEVFTAPGTATLAPSQHARLEGRPGKTYKIIIDNDDEDLEAIVFVHNDGKWIYNKYNLAPGDTTKKTFQMGPNGFIHLWNSTDPKFTPNPLVTFSIRGVR